MQKNFRDFTINELLEMGFKVDVNNHNSKTIEEAKNITRKIEGIKISGFELDENTHVVRGWKKGFEICSFIKR